MTDNLGNVQDLSDEIESEVSEAAAEDAIIGEQQDAEESLIEKLKKDFTDCQEKLQKEVNTAKEQLLRTAAEYDNYRKRATKEKEASFNNGVSCAVEKILVILDTLEMAAQAPTQDEEYKKGVIMTLDKSKNALESLGVKEIDALNQPFNPELHAAVMRQAQEGAESDTVISVFQKGYILGDKVIRHATVVVAE